MIWKKKMKKIIKNLIVNLYLYGIIKRTTLMYFFDKLELYND